MRGKPQIMGGKLTCHLNSKEQKYISEHITDILENLAPLYKHHYCNHLLAHLRNNHMTPTELRPLIQHADVVTRGGIVLEGTLPQCVGGIWTHRHLQVTSSFAVESRDAREVFEGGWGCKTEFALSGCQIFTSIPEHCELVDNMCRHITGISGDKLACWDCPTAFPVFIQPPHSAPVCLATSSYEEQTQWASVLRAATLHQSSVLWCETSPESRTFLDAVLSLKKLRGKNQTEVLPVGNEEEVLVGMVMEEITSYLKEEVFPRITAHRSRKKKIWIKLLCEVYKTAKHQIKADMVALKEELSLYRSDMQKQITATLHQTYLLQDQIAHMITEDICEPMLQCLHHNIIPRLHRTLQEVAIPICDGVASIWLFFLDACDDIIDVASTSTSANDTKKEMLKLQNGPDSVRMWKCLDRLKLNSEGRVWLQDTWGVAEETWRPSLLRAQNALYRVVDMCARMFWRLVSRYPCFSSDSSQLTAVMCRVKHRVVKNLESELLALRSQLILEMILQITLPAFEQGVKKQDLSRYNTMVSSEQAVFIHADVIFTSILRDNLSSYIQSEMRHSLPHHFVPLAVCPSSPCSSSSGFSKPVNHCQQNPSSGSETLAPGSVTDTEDIFSSSKNSEKHILLDAGEYIHLAEPGRSHRTP